MPIYILRIYRRYTKVNNYPQSNSVRHFSTQTNKDMVIMEYNSNAYLYIIGL